MAFFLWMSRLDGQLQDVGGGMGVLDLQFAFTAEKGRQILEVWGENGRALARQGLIWDCVYPLVYGLAFEATLIRLFSSTSRWRNLIVLLPLWTILFDYGENFLHWQTLRIYPIIDGAVLQLASSWALVKWALVATMIFLMGYKLVRRQFLKLDPA
ncbi:MAG: hypothetical protein K9N11_09755 [Lentisphaeria bacterium]|nr:hypothetical protein [Candidatus Neomarinimicrobiota bacterium]MCF7843117.1 hypothetical protein [Lentisphaeria bacterium]